MKTFLLLPDHRAQLDGWTRRNMFLRTRAALRRQCSVCGAHARDAGVDHLERWHSHIPHAPACPCRWDEIRAHLDTCGLPLVEQFHEVVIDPGPDEAY